MLKPINSTSLKALLRRDDGATLIEYSILIGLITVTVIFLVISVGGWASEKWAELDSVLTECGDLPEQSEGQGCAEGRK